MWEVASTRHNYVGSINPPNCAFRPKTGTCVSAHDWQANIYKTRWHHPHAPGVASADCASTKNDIFEYTKPFSCSCHWTDKLLYWISRNCLSVCKLERVFALFSRMKQSWWTKSLY